MQPSLDCMAPSSPGAGKYFMGLLLYFTAILPGFTTDPSPKVARILAQQSQMLLQREQQAVVDSRLTCASFKFVSFIHSRSSLCFTPVSGASHDALYTLSAARWIFSMMVAAVSLPEASASASPCLIASATSWS